MEQLEQTLVAMATTIFLIKQWNKKPFNCGKIHLWFYIDSYWRNVAQCVNLLKLIDGISTITANNSTNIDLCVAVSPRDNSVPISHYEDSAKGNVTQLTQLGNLINGLHQIHGVTAYQTRGS
jgi:hypothetical protein